MRKRIGSGLLRLSRLSFYALLALVPLASHWVVRQRDVSGFAADYASTLFHVADIPLIITLSAWLLANVLDPTIRIRLSPLFLTVPLLILFLLVITSAAWAPLPVLTFDLSVRLLVLLGLYLFVANEIREHRWPALALAAGLGVQSLVAVGQFLARAPLGLKALGEPEFYTFTPGATVIQIGAERWLRGYGLSQSPNFLGAVLTLGLFALLGWAMLSARPGGWLAVVALGVSGLICTFSRGAWLGLGAGLLVVGILLWRSPARRKQMRPAWWRFVAVGLGVGLAFTAIYPRLVATRLLLGADSSLETLNLDLRYYYQQVALDQIEDHPLTGVGGRNSVAVAVLETPPRWGHHSYQPVHNVLLLLTAELGLGGGLLWLALWIGLALVVWQSRARIGRDPWLLAWTGALLALGIASNFDHYLLTSEEGRLLLWISLGLWASAAHPASAARDRVPAEKSPHGP